MDREKEGFSWDKRKRTYTGGTGTLRVGRLSLG